MGSTSALWSVRDAGRMSYAIHNPIVSRTKKSELTHLWCSIFLLLFILTIGRKLLTMCMFFVSALRLFRCSAFCNSDVHSPSSFDISTITSSSSFTLSIVMLKILIMLATKRSCLNDDKFFAFDTTGF